MTIYYVSPSGNNSNNGTSTSTPFATIQKGVDSTSAGDTVRVMAGTYSATLAQGYVLATAKSGTAGSPIIIEGYNSRPIITLPNGGVAAVQMNGSYMTFRGFELIGNANSITLSAAQANAASSSPTADKTYLANGVSTSWNGNSVIEHHIVISDNIIHDFPGAGIVCVKSDYITIEKNTVYGCAKYSTYGNSGMTIYGSHDIDSVTGYKNFVTGNILYDNRQLVASTAIGSSTPTDGEGLLIDDNSNDQTDNQAYKGGTLISNNVAYNNGSAGLAAYASANCDFLYNTCYGNDPSVSHGGNQIGVTRLAGGKIQNNAVYGTNNAKTIGVDGTSSGISTDYNVMFGGSSAKIGTHDIVADPKFVNAAGNDFTLQASSPAIGAANSAYTVATDQKGNTRPTNGKYDIGAYQYQGTTTTTPTTPTNPTTPTTPTTPTVPHQVFPAGQFLAWAGQHVNGSRVSTTLNKSGKLAALATADGANWCVQVINYDTANAFSGFKVAVQSGDALSPDITIHQLSPSQNDAVITTPGYASLMSTGINLPAESITHITGTFASAIVTSVVSAGLIPLFVNGVTNYITPANFYAALSGQ